MKRNKGELLFSVTMADCDFNTFQAGGKGGQHQNHTNTAVRIKHRASGAVGESRDSRSQHQNKESAFRRMIETTKFKTWLQRESWIRQGLPTPEEQVNKTLIPENLRIEYKESGKWVEVNKEE